MTAPRLTKTCLLTRPCTDCGADVLVRRHEGSGDICATVLCADCLEQRVWAVREARQPRKPGSGRKPGQGRGPRGRYRPWVPVRP